MELSELFSGSTGSIYASSCIIIILAMILIMTGRLLLNRRRKAYLTFTLSLVVTIIQYAMIIHFHAGGSENALPTDYFIVVLQVVSFIFINMGIYQLYNSSRVKEYMLFYAFLAGTVLIAVLYYRTVAGLDSPSEAELLFHALWMELYLFVLLFLGFMLVSPHVGQTLKYQVGLTVYFVTQLIHMTNRYIVSDPVTALIVAEKFLPLVYFAILFLIIFDRVVELLQAVYRSSITDGLTGLYNRRFFFNRTEQYVQRNIPVSVLFGDIDNFKKLNDTKGHQVGDEALKAVAKIMMEESEDIGIAGRYGGEEMVVLVTDTQVKVEELAEHIRQRVEAETIVTISMGYSRHRKGVTAEGLIKQADQAMYKAKTSGKNKVVKYSVREKEGAAPLAE